MTRTQSLFICAYHRCLLQAMMVHMNSCNQDHMVCKAKKCGPSRPFQQKFLTCVQILYQSDPGNLLSKLFSGKKRRPGHFKDLWTQTWVDTNNPKLKHSCLSHWSGTIWQINGLLTQVTLVVGLLGLQTCWWAFHGSLKAEFWNGWLAVSSSYQVLGLY